VVKANVAASAVATGAGNQAQVGIGIDSTTVNSADLFPLSATNTVTNGIYPITAQWEGFPGVGRHFLAWLEIAQAAGTTTWEGNNPGAIAGANTHSGIAGELWG
jgi:hypothetical protein